MGERCIGKCGNCGGRVTVPTYYLSVVPPVPTCASCGATAKPQGPTIEMNPAPRTGFVDRDGTYRDRNRGGWTLSAEGGA